MKIQKQMFGIKMWIMTLWQSWKTFPERLEENNIMENLQERYKCTEGSSF